MPTTTLPATSPIFVAISAAFDSRGYPVDTASYDADDETYSVLTVAGTTIVSEPIGSDDDAISFRLPGESDRLIVPVDFDADDDGGDFCSVCGTSSDAPDFWSDEPDADGNPICADCADCADDEYSDYPEFCVNCGEPTGGTDYVCADPDCADDDEISD